jgi:multicomponent Na+:H+ antiporter subunit F
MINADAVHTATEIALAVLSLGVVIAVIRLVRGPTLADRVVAIDLIANQAVAMLAAAAIAFDEPSLFQPALVLTLIAFIGTVAFARYVEKRATL